MKRCSQCGSEQLASEFYPSRSARDGLKSYCKTCGRAASSSYYRDHAAEQNAKTQAKYWQDPAKKSAYDREYRAKHRERIAADKAAGLAKRRAQGWRPKPNPAVVKVRSARWYAANAERAKRRVAMYRQANREKYIAWGQAYRVKRRAAGAGVTAAQWLAIRRLFGSHCLRCGTLPSRLTMDHVLPLSLGGRHDIWNVQQLCKSCNSRKHRTIADYRPAGWEQAIAELGARADFKLGEPARAIRDSARRARSATRSPEYGDQYRPVPNPQGVLPV